MDIAKAKEFLYMPHDEETIYISKDLQTLLDRSNGDLISVYAVVETASGETLCYMDFSYAGEPIIMRRFIHKDYFMKHYQRKKIIAL